MLVAHTQHDNMRSARGSADPANAHNPLPRAMLEAGTTVQTTQAHYFPPASAVGSATGGLTPFPSLTL